jgi:peptide/nickel transport system substrate-binding protein
LVGLDSNLEVVPQLATAWRLVNPTVWEFDLRPDVRFHDGTPLTAADVVFSFIRAKTKLPMGLAVRLESIAAVSAPDERTVRIETKFPDPQLWAEVLVIYIMPERWATAHDARVPANVDANEENHATRHANGTGPFIVKEFEPDGRWSWCATRTGGACSVTRTTSTGSNLPRLPIHKSASRRCSGATSTSSPTRRSRRSIGSGERRA